MGDVSVVYKILPGDINANVDEIAKKAKEIAVGEGLTVKGSQIIDIAFGLRGVLVLVVMPDTGGVSEKVEKLYMTIPEVQSVEIADLSL